jgi:DNA-directed RNA polymerase specialized sigma24 family protein
MEGYSNEEVADKLGCSLRSVARKVELIRRTWLGEEATDT